MIPLRYNGASCFLFPCLLSFSNKIYKIKIIIKEGLLKKRIIEHLCVHSTGLHTVYTILKYPLVDFMTLNQVLEMFVDYIQKIRDVFSERKFL